MGAVDYIVLAVILLIVGLAAFYVIREKRRGTKCIGCPSGGCDCASRNRRPSHGGGSPCSSCCSGGCREEEDSSTESSDAENSN